MEQIVFAKSKYIPTSATKSRRVVDLIRGKNALLALDILKFSNKAIAHEVYKTVNSAIRNAVHNSNLDKKNLLIAEAYVNDAPVFKRGRAVARGRYHQILKRNCHIIIGVKDTAVKTEAKQVVKQTAKVE